MDQRTGLEWLARAGYGARGLVYLIVGGFAVLAAWGTGGGGTTDTKGALRTLLDQPFGTALLVVVAVGLFGFAAWRFMQGVFDADGRGSDGKALVRRAVWVGSGVLYLGLVAFALSLAFGWGAGGGGSGDSSAQDWTARLMAQPFGRWLVALVGLGVIGGAVAMARKAWTGRFMAHLEPPPERHWVERLGMAGISARAVVFLLIGIFLLVAAWQAQATEARGLNGALQALQAQPYGWVLLGLVALGLVAFGAFGFVQAVYRRVEPPRMPVRL